MIGDRSKAMPLAYKLARPVMNLHCAIRLWRHIFHSANARSEKLRLTEELARLDFAPVRATRKPCAKEGWRVLRQLISMQP